MIEGTWRNGAQTVRGRWFYNWPKDHFVIELDRRSRITGQALRFTVHGDRPEWGKWRIARVQERRT